MSEWREIKLGEFIRLQRGHDLTASERKPGRIPVVGSAGENGFHDTALCSGPGLTIGRSGVGSMGVVTFVPTEYWPHNTVLYATDFLGNDPRFAYYFLRHFDLRRYDSGSAQASLNRNYIYPLRIRVPEPPEQKIIAEVLGTLDDKIELNGRMSATLEAMARALFRSWFVDFDPVRAKLDGRPSAFDPSTAALFPALFEDSPLGRIPKGWETSTVGAKLSTVLGGTPSRAKPEYWEGGTVAWINSGKTNEFRIIDPSEWITREALENSATKLLPPRTTVLAITGATLGQVSIAEIECCANQSVVAIPASEQLPTEFIYPWIEENIERLIASQTGGAQQHINKGNVEELALLCPERRVVAAYHDKVKPLFDQIAANCFQSRTLAALRDALMPKLLTAELDVSRISNAGSQ